MKQLLALLACLGVVCAASAQGTATLAERNKATAIAWWKALNTGGWDAASQYLSPKYHEHSGSAPSGAADLKTYYSTLKQRRPDHHSLIKRAFAENEIVFLHVHDIQYTGDFGTAMMVFLRFENGKIAEQWTLKQAVPGIRNFNGVF